MLAYVLLGVAQTIGLLLIPLGGPGVWIQLAALGLFGWWTKFASIGPTPLLILFLLALTAELIEGLLVGGRADPAGRRVIGFAGLACGGIGAGLGFLFPLIGTAMGALAGALTGSLVGTMAAPSRVVGWGGLAARVIATSVRTAAGVVVAVFALLTLIR